MSKATKRKHVTKEVLDTYVLPSEKQEIVKVLASRGNNLHEVENVVGERFLVSMPTKFRRNVWIKRGDYVMTDPIEEGDKVKAEISHILYQDQIQYIKDENLWPKEFAENRPSASEMIPEDMLPPSDDEDYDEEESIVTANPNRPVVTFESDEDSSEEEEDEEKQNEDVQEREKH